MPVVTTCVLVSHPRTLDDVALYVSALESGRDGLDSQNTPNNSQAKSPKVNR